MDKDLGKEIVLEGNILGKRKIMINKSKLYKMYIVILQLQKKMKKSL
ncbi:hypothetical protein [Clostridium sp.]|nr:hypothetical protein [Clostridium sp.]MBP3916969.1 hypothetical protein [Clostridium sp.]